MSLCFVQFRKFTYFSMRLRFFIEYFMTWILNKYAPNMGLLLIDISFNK